MSVTRMTPKKNCSHPMARDNEVTPAVHHEYLLNSMMSLCMKTTCHLSLHGCYPNILWRGGGALLNVT